MLLFINVQVLQYFFYVAFKNSFRSKTLNTNVLGTQRSGWGKCTASGASDSPDGFAS